MTAPRSIAVLRCSAAGVPLGLAAEDVASFDAHADQAPRLAALLGLPGQARGAERTLSLRADSGQVAALVQVEGPVRIRSVTADELLPLPPLLARSRMGLVIGFLEEAGQVVVLLDVVGLIELARRGPAAETRSPC